MLAHAEQGALVTAEAWGVLSGHVPRCGDNALGGDMSSPTSLSACAGVWESGRAEAIVTVPSDPPLETQGRALGSFGFLIRARDSGVLVESEGRVADPQCLLSEADERWGEPVAIAADRFRKPAILDALEAVGWPTTVTWRWGRTQIHEDISALGAWVLSRRLAPQRSELLDHSMASVVVTSDVVDNLGWAHRAKRPDDLAVVVTNAVGSLSRW